MYLSSEIFFLILLELLQKLLGENRCHTSMEESLDTLLFLKRDYFSSTKEVEVINFCFLLTLMTLYRA